MKNGKEKNANGLLIAIIIVAVLLVAVIGLILWLEFGGQNVRPTQQNPSAAQPAQKPTAPSGKDEATKPADATKPSVSVDDYEQLQKNGAIGTPYLTLYYSTELVDNLAVVHNEGTPYVVEFYAILEEKQEQRLFDILFGDGKEGNLGVIRTDAGEISVSMVIYEFTPDETWTQGEIDTVLAMQDVANDLVDQLMEYQVKDQISGPELSTEEPDSNYVEYMAIETPYCTLSYPATWQDYLQTEHTQTDVYRVDFYGQLVEQDPVLLFAILLGGDSGEQIGAIKDSNGQYVTVNIVMADMDLDGFSQEEATILYQMQEELNQLIAKLPLE